MQKVIAALKLVLADIARFQVPTYATAVAGIVVPIVAAVAGVHITPAEVGGWLIIAGGAAAAVEKLTSGKAAAKVAQDAVVPMPPVPPAA